MDDSKSGLKKPGGLLESKTRHKGQLKQPNSSHCFVCGLENETGLRLTFYEDPAGFVFSDVILPERYQGYPDVVHGGIVACMLDEIAGRAAMIQKPHHFMFTGRMEIRYRRPVPTGQPLRLTGRIIQQRSRTAVAESKIELPDGAIGAEAEVTLVRVPDLDLDQAELEALGWRVYPDEVQPGSREGNHPQGC